MEKLDGKSKDILRENIEKLKKIFPEIVIEGNIDFDKLKTTLGEYVDDREERYRFSWSGKAQAKRLAQTPSTGTLRPCKEESVNWGTTENLFIEGDNLEVLKLLQKTYHKKVKMIYIDPPYNTGRDFIYKDNFKDNIKNYLELTGQIDEEGKKLSTNTETSGRFHTDWLNMMYPRLKLAKNILRDDGLIFISIDENEITNLRKLCNEIFGEENFVNNVIWKKTNSPKSQSNALGNQYEYVLIYARNYEKVETNKSIGQIDEGFKATFNHDDQDGKGPYQTVAIIAAGTQRSVKRKTFEFHAVTDQWLYKIETLEQWWEDGKIYKTSGGKYRLKKYLHEMEGRLLSDIWIDDEIKPLQGGSSEYMGFITQKPTSLIKRMLKFCIDKESIVMDFFAGSCSTAHAVLASNIEEGCNRKFVMIQLPEPCGEDSEFSRNGFKTIVDIGKDRLRRVINKIRKEHADCTGDLGFKVFKLNSSNIKTWDSDFDTLEKSLLDSVDNIKKDRSAEDVLYEILLKYGLDLTLPIEERKICKKTVYSIGLGALIVCLDKDISLDVVEGIAKLKEELKPEVARVVFSDAGFKDDVVKTNTVQILKQHGIEDVKSI